MREIVEHKVLHARGIDAIQTAISTAIKDGWQPYGELHIPTFMWTSFTQVVVKYK